jgi:hypothetical protein
LGDLTVKVVEYNYDVAEVDGEKPVIRVAFMQVSRKVLRDSSTAWNKILNSAGSWNEASSPLVELHKDTVIGLELWFRCLHGTMTEEMNGIPVNEIWHGLEVCRKYFLKVEMLNGWFFWWWRGQNKPQMELEEMKDLLYPCHEFEHAEGFAYLTKSLAYETRGHIAETNPTHHRHLHLRHPITRKSTKRL